MKRVAAKFSSFQEAERAEREYYRSLTPQQRLDLRLELNEALRKEGDAASERLRESVESLNSHHVEYLIVGAFALAFHVVPRSTGDIDILVRRSRENAARIESVLIDFSFASLGLSAAEIVQLGQPPNRIDLLTSITGIEFDEASARRVAASLHGIPVHFIGRECLIRNKRATGRPRDLADLEALDA